MKQLHLAVLLTGVLGASAAQAVVLSPGDVVTGEVNKVVHIDPATGDRTTVSCSNTLVCPSGLVGSGPGVMTGSAMGLESDGSLVVAALLGPNNDNVLLRIDPATGDRAVISGPGVGTGDDLGLFSSLVVVPPATTSAVSVLPSWGLALLVGIAIGAWLQLRRMRELKTT